MKRAMMAKKLIAISVVTLLFFTGSANAVPNIFTQGTPARAAEVNENFTDLDNKAIALESRMSALENAAPSSVATTIDVNCASDADFFTSPAYKDNERDNVVYNISGPCNGPVEIRNDDVSLIGVDAAAAVILPAGIDILGSNFGATILVAGAARVFISDLTVDVSAYSTEESSSGAIYSFNGAHTTINNITSIGSRFGIGASDGAFIRATGSNTISDYVSDGLFSASQSAVIVDGPITLTSSDEGGQYHNAVEARGHGYIEFRNDVNISTLGNLNAIFRAGIRADFGSIVTAQSGNPVEVIGAVQAENNSLVSIANGTVDGSFFSGKNSQMSLNQIVQLNVSVGAGFTQVAHGRFEAFNTQFSGNILVTSNSTFRVFDSVVPGDIDATTGSQVNLSSVNSDLARGNIKLNGARAEIGSSKLNSVFAQNSADFISGQSTITGDVQAFSASRLIFNNGEVNGNISVEDASFLKMGSTNHNPTLPDATLIMRGARAQFDNNTIGADIFLEDASTLRFFDGSIIGNVVVGSGSYLNLGNVTQSPNLQVSVNNSRLNTFGSTLGFIDTFNTASLDLNQTTYAGGSINGNSYLVSNGSNTTANIVIFNNSAVSMFQDNGAGSLNNNTLFLCGSNDRNFIEGFDPDPNIPDTDFAATGTVSLDCQF